ncbi:fetuin-B-like isoform X3 [Lissotriton helveticus]
MKQITAALCFTLLSLGSALSPQPLEPEDCNATEVQAGLALDEINKDRDEGYILSLYRVADAHSQPAGPGRIFYLTIDVVQTTCSVLSGKSWKDCEINPSHQTVFGQCKAVLYLNLPWRKVKLYSYNCTLSTVPPRLIADMCPDCPLLERITPGYIEKAEELVENYNIGSNNTNYFILDKVEKASMQWVVGASYFVEFSMRETNCSRLVENTSDCEVLEDDKAHVGFCKGESLTPTSPSEFDLFVSCKIYAPKPDPHHRHRGCGRRSQRHGHRHGHKHGPGHKHDHHHPHGHNHTHSEDRNHQEERPANSHGRKDGKRPSEPHGHGHRLGKRNSEKHGRGHGKGHGKGYGQEHGRGPPNGGHKHHGSSSEEHTGPKPMPPTPAGPVGSVQLIYMENESDVFPVPTIPDPSPSAPTGSPAGPDQFKDPEPQPFPLVPSNSSGCPAEPKHQISHIASLLPLPK